MLNYIKYQIREGHIEVIGHDNTEIGLTLNGKVDLYSKIEFNNISYNIRKIANDGFKSCSSLKEINIPTSISEIGDRSFAGCSSLTKISLPNSISEIGDETFAGCSSLTKISLPDLITQIGDGAFSWCKSLTHIDIPEGVMKIYDAFRSCPKLICISLPSSINYFTAGNDYDFCCDLKYIYCKSNIPPEFYSEWNNFTYYRDIILFVPQNAIKEYKSSSWAKLLKYADIIGVDTKTFDLQEYLKKQGVYE